MFFKEGKCFLPTIYSLFHSVKWRVVVPNAVAGIVVSMKFIIFALFLQLFFMLIYLFNIWCTVVVSKDA